MELLLLFTALTACIFAIYFPVSAWEDYEIVSVEAMNDTKKYMDFKVKYKRINKTSYGLSGSVELKNLDGLESELLVYHSEKGGNNQFVLTAYKLARGKICETLNRDYRKFLMEPLHPFSNFPFSDDDDEDLCPQFYEINKFEMKNFIMTNETIPGSMEYGTYKIHIKMYEGEVVVSGIQVVVRLF